MKRPRLALACGLLLLLGAGGEAQGFLIPPSSSLKACGPIRGEAAAAAIAIGAAAVTGAGAGARAVSACRPRRRPAPLLAPLSASSVEEQEQEQEQGQQGPGPQSPRSTKGRRRKAGQESAHRKQQQVQQRQEMNNLPAAPERPKKPMLTNVVSWLAGKFIRRIAKVVSGLDIEVGARSNGDVLAGNLPRVQAKFDRIVLESLQISGGGQMEITGLNVRVLGLLLARRLNIIRRPFEIFGQYVLTQQDVSASKLIRDLIQLLVNNVLRTLFPSLHLTFFDVAIDQVRIRDQKLAIMGTASIAESEDGMPFTLLTGVGLAGDGHIVYLDNPELVLNPDAPLPVKVPLGSIRAFDVDIGDNARIERIEIDDRLGVSITARTLITPAPPFHVTDVGKRAAFLYDVGAFFSAFFGFTHFSELNLEAVEQSGRR